MAKKIIKNEEISNRVTLPQKESVLNILKRRLEVAENRITELAYLLEYDFETLDDESRTKLLEEKLNEQIRLRQQRIEDEKRRKEEEEQKRIEEAAQKMLEAKLKEEEQKRKINEAAAELLKRTQQEKEEAEKRQQEIEENERLLKLQKEREELAAKAAAAEIEHLEAKTAFEEKVKEEDQKIKEAKQKAAENPDVNPYEKGSIEHIVWKRKQQAKKKR